ncbi:hypothetical protein [uncultured Rubinisphaera sp.]|uniref:hypothetical protein n=1 Tax=uncultured Rubinisphaera sp. TaxID=1678686 RepID=UPI0030D9CE9A
MEVTNKFTDDPSATYRGYRRQALYCLYRLFDEGLTEQTVVQPEGNEDLAIWNESDELLEAVQVKDHSTNLTVSSFKPSFFRRISDLCKNDPSANIKIVSFGHFGPELKKACDNDQDTPIRALNTLTKDREETDTKCNKKTVKGLNAKEAEAILSRLTLEVVDEATLTNFIITKLSATLTSGNPSVAFENLMWWLISSAELQRRLTRLLTINKIVQLGKFLTHREAHSHEWNISIKPIEHSFINEDQREKLKSEFFQGGRVRVDHLAAGLDVPRHQAIDRIHRAFQQENVVILRAASGQGKTTLAYRYLLDWTPSDFRFQVEQAANLKHARLMAAAIAGHAEVIDVPTVVYIDVRPGDNLWVEFVRALAGTQDVRVLVTIREEDWFRCRVTKDDFSFMDISMQFSNDSGERLFNELRANGYGYSQLNFKDAWAKLGDRKTLFEFVYLVTQNEQLTDKIRAQIALLKDEVNVGKMIPPELHLLRLVAVASAYESRLDLIKLVDSVGIPEPTRTLQRFSNEYLLRTSNDGRYVEGFHAIRSEIIAAELTDPVLNPRGEIETALPRIIVEDDLESFLLCSFSRYEIAAQDIVKSLYGLPLRTWVGTRAVLVAIQWLGLKLYADENIELIDEVRSLSVMSWWITLDWDLAQVKGQEGFGFFRALAKKSKEFDIAATVSEEFQIRQTDKNRVFTLAVEWLRSFRIPTEDATSVSQFMAMGEVLYWLGHLELTNLYVMDWLNVNIISNAWEALPDHLFAQFALGVQQCSQETYDTWFKNNDVKLRARIRESSSIIALVKEDDCLVSHFVIDFDRNSSEMQPAEQEASINDLAVQRVNIVSACIPGFSRYGASGYGHRMSFFENLNDDSTKRMPIENITMPWLPEFNALARGVVEIRFRPDSWSAYFDRIRITREKVLMVLDDIRFVTSRIHKVGIESLIDKETWNDCKQLVNGEFFLPKSAVDEWGFLTESRAKQNDNMRNKRFSAISELDPLNKAINEYTRTVGNFLNQSCQALELVPYLKMAQTEAARNVIIAKARELGFSEDVIRLSIINGMDACIAVRQMHRVELSLQNVARIEFDDAFRASEIDAFRASEIDAFIQMIQSWALFFYPNQFLQAEQKRKKNSVKKRQHNLPRRNVHLGDCLRSTRNRIKQALKQLKGVGIIAHIISEEVRWHDDSALWISFDCDHPTGSLFAIEILWQALFEAFSPDRNKIVRVKAIDWFWEKIVLVPLVQGCSIDRKAYANMRGVSNTLDENLQTQLWRLLPEEIPENAWKHLGLPEWDRVTSWELFDRITASYVALFYHVDHMADFTRCEINLDEEGDVIALRYLQFAAKRVEPILKEMYDSCEALFKRFIQYDDSVFETRPNLLDCMEHVLGIKNAIQPSDDFNEKGCISLDEIANWRDRLKDGLNLLGYAQTLWIADSLEFDGFDSSNHNNSESQP